ncbi:MAG: oxidoreductase [Flavobacteriales bacterium]|nr:oxidoreductase [Flavobacteriales bacterium]|tara:strand:- start:1379 stop:2065 length:687 start_codon:yes stop_codon:yes gene_type:complete
MKNILIVGASSGIGKEIAKQFLNLEDYNLILASRSKPDLEGDFQYRELDVMGEVDLDLPDELHGLVYAPGSINLKPFHRLNEEDFLNDFQLNTIGAVKVIQTALKSLKNSKNASIVLFSTVAVGNGLSFHTSVSSAKGALEGLGRALSAELAPHIRVNMIAPSLTDTPLAERLLSSDEKRKANAERHPLKKIGTTSDIANAARYLLTDESAWTTGQTLTIDGGLSVIR